MNFKLCDVAIKKADLSFSCVCPVIYNELRQNFVKVASRPIQLVAEFIYAQLLWLCYDEIHDQ